MKRVGVIGDTHGDMHAMRAMIEKIGAVELVLTMGGARVPLMLSL